VFATEQDRPDIVPRRTWWKRHQSKIDPSRLVFIDETWAKTNMARTHGWWQRGIPLRAHVPHGHWRTMTFLAALRHDRIAAPCVIIAFPAGTPPGGVAFGNVELLQLVAGEMFRQGHVVPNQRQICHWTANAVVAGPGSRPISPVPLPAKITPLSVAIEEANNHARRVMERKAS
jgi:hypothetical protein